MQYLKEIKMSREKTNQSVFWDDDKSIDWYLAEVDKFKLPADKGSLAWFLAVEEKINISQYLAKIDKNYLSERFFGVAAARSNDKNMYYLMMAAIIQPNENHYYWLGKNAEWRKDYELALYAYKKSLALAPKKHSNYAQRPKEISQDMIAELEKTLQTDLTDLANIFNRSEIIGQFTKKNSLLFNWENTEPQLLSDDSIASNTKLETEFKTLCLDINEIIKNLRKLLTLQDLFNNQTIRIISVLSKMGKKSSDIFNEITSLT